MANLQRFRRCQCFSDSLIYCPVRSDITVLNNVAIKEKELSRKLPAEGGGIGVGVALSKTSSETSVGEGITSSVGKISITLI